MMESHDPRMGKVRDAQVMRLDHSGAWARLDDHTEVFIPLAEISWFEIEHPTDKLAEGDTVQVKITGKGKDECLEGSIRQVEAN